MVGCAVYLQRSVPARLPQRGGDRIHGAVRQVFPVHAVPCRERGRGDRPAILQCVLLVDSCERVRDDCFVLILVRIESRILCA